MDLLWGASDGPDLVIACTRDGLRLRIGSAVPPTLVADLESAEPTADLNVPSPIVERIQLRLQDAFGAAVGLTPGSGPSYFIPEGVTASAAPNAQLVRSDASDASALADANPGHWGDDEWQNVLAGSLGPWVMAVVERRVVSICHTPVSNSRAADAGVWTHPEFRGQGHAAACTAEWARLMRPSGRLLF